MISFINVDIELNRKAVFSNLNLTVQPGELVYLAGRSGSGKSTLLRAMYMDIMPKKGEIQIAGYSSRTIKKRQIPLLRRKLGIVFQDFRLLEDRTVYDNLAFVLKVTGTKEKLIPEKVMQALESIGLQDAAKAMPDRLSGGEQQRVSIARALVREPQVILADEPTGNLDPDTSLEILEYLRKINRQGIIVVVGTHDYELIRHSPARTLLITDGTLSQADLRETAAGWRPVPA